MIPDSVDKHVPPFWHSNVLQDSESDITFMSNFLMFQYGQNMYDIVAFYSILKYNTYLNCSKEFNMKWLTMQIYFEFNLIWVFNWKQRMKYNTFDNTNECLLLIRVRHVHYYTNSIGSYLQIYFESWFSTSSISPTPGSKSNISQVES